MDEDALEEVQRLVWVEASAKHHGYLFNRMRVRVWVQVRSTLLLKVWSVREQVHNKVFNLLGRLHE